jgi:hypothetical protein
MTEELHRRITNMVGRNLPSAQTDQPAAESSDDENAAPTPESPGEFGVVSTMAASGARPQLPEESRELPRPSRNSEEFAVSGTEDIALQHSTQSTIEDSEVVLRRHGGALPK